MGPSWWGATAVPWFKENAGRFPAKVEEIEATLPCKRDFTKPHVGRAAGHQG